jgi:amino acid adenylation domain-containing protein
MKAPAGNEFQLLPVRQRKSRIEVNSTDAPVSSEMLHTLFMKQVFEYPDRVAVISSGGSLSYEELYKRSCAVSYLLSGNGGCSNGLVGIVMEKGCEQVVGVLGVLQSGGAYLPIDSDLPKERFWYLLKNGGVNLVLTQSWLDEVLKWPDGVKRLCVDKISSSNGVDSFDIVPNPDDLAYVVYTSGSTGLPKGVMVDHRGAVNTIIDINRRFGVSYKDRVLALSSLSFDLSVYDIFGILAAGGAIVLPDADRIRDPSHWLELMRKDMVTVWNSVPMFMQMLVEYASGSNKVLSESLRLVLLSGDWIPLDLPGKCKALVDGVEVISLGGATEASIWSILYSIGKIDPGWSTIPYGLPMTNQRFSILNDFMDDCPDWVTGKLYIGGIGVAKGYWRDEEKTKDSFIIHPRTGERLYCTGDLGRWLPDGNIEFLGREDFQVKIRGYRIELGEIETALREHPGVKDAVVNAVGDPHGDKRLIGYVVLDEGEFSTADLQNFLRRKLPEYMVPVSFIVLDALPLPPTGKIDRKSLSELEALPSEAKVRYVAPQTELERVVEAILQEVIVGIDKIGIHDNFFDLGINSVHMIRIQNKLEQRLKRKISVLDLFEYPNISSLTECLSQDRPEHQIVKQAQKRAEMRKGAKKRRGQRKRGRFSF